MTKADPYAGWSASDRLQMLAFEAELANLPRSLIAAVWDASDRFRAMPWQPSEEHDKEIRRWMKSKGWEVNRRGEYDSDTEVHCWRHDVRGGPSPTLRISRQVLESYPAFVLLYHMDKLKVARAIRAQPESRLVVVQKGSAVVLNEES